MSLTRKHLLLMLAPLALTACEGMGGSKVGPNGEPILSPEERRLQTVEDAVAQLQRRAEAQDQAGTSQELTRLLDEVRALRGDVENLRYDLDRKTNSDKQLFSNLDQRLAAIEGGGALAPAAQATPGASPGTLTAVTPAAAAASRPAVASPEEEAAYLATFDLLKNGRYDEAIKGFRKMLEQWPEGRYADNAWYWMGEAQYVKRDYPSALQSFQSLVQRFPSSPKMPDALLKAGLCQVELKRSSDARGLFQRVVNEFPNSNAATLAKQSLQQLGG